MPGLDYLWFTPCFTSTHFSDAHIIPVHLFWSRGSPSFIFSRPHPSQIFCAYYTRCISLIRPNPSVHDSLYHADRLIRHWVGGVSLRICAQHCPAGLLLEWLFAALMGMGLSIPSHPHRHNVVKAFQGDLVLFHHHSCELLHHPAVAWQKWDMMKVALHLGCRDILIWKVIRQAFSLREKCILFLNGAYWDCICVLSHSFTYLNIGVSPRRNVCLELKLMNIMWNGRLLLFDSQVAATFENLQASNYELKLFVIDSLLLSGIVYWADFKQTTNKKNLSPPPSFGHSFVFRLLYTLIVKSCRDVKVIVLTRQVYFFQNNWSGLVWCTLEWLYEKKHTKQHCGLTHALDYGQIISFIWHFHKSIQKN